MSDEYMPSTDEIRELVRAASAFETLSGVPASEVLAAFDRWLAAHDARVRAAAQASAFEQGAQALAWAIEHGDDPARYIRENNPYRAVPAEQKESN